MDCCRPIDGGLVYLGWASSSSHRNGFLGRIWGYLCGFAGQEYLGVTLAGEKRFLGFVETDMENATVLTPFLLFLLSVLLSSFGFTRSWGKILAVFYSFNRLMHWSEVFPRCFSILATMIPERP